MAAKPVKYVDQGDRKQLFTPELPVKQPTLILLYKQYVPTVTLQ